MRKIRGKPYPNPIECQYIQLLSNAILWNCNKIPWAWWTYWERVNTWNCISSIISVTNPQSTLIFENGMSKHCRRILEGKWDNGKGRNGGEVRERGWELKNEKTDDKLCMKWNVSCTNRLESIYNAFQQIKHNNNNYNNHTFGAQNKREREKGKLCGKLLVVWMSLFIFRFLLPSNFSLSFFLQPLLCRSR